MVLYAKYVCTGQIVFYEQQERGMYCSLIIKLHLGKHLRNFCFDVLPTNDLPIACPIFIMTGRHYL